MIMGSLANQTLPTIIFSEENLKPGSSSWISTSKQVVGALEEFGSFMVTYSNFPSHLTEAIFGASKEAFALPIEAKVGNVNDSRSYLATNLILPLLERLMIDYATTEEGVGKFTNQLWPSGNDSFRETVLEYSKAVAQLDQVVMTMVSEVYGITSSYQSLQKASSYVFGFLKYHERGDNETQVGLMAHSDNTFTSILHQYHVGGLEFETKNGHWIATDPSPSAFVVLAGNALMGWSNGRIHSAQHRVITEGSKPRYSIGMFSFIDDVEIRVPEELVDQDHPLQFKPFDNHKYFKFALTEEGRNSKQPLMKYCGV